MATACDDMNLRLFDLHKLAAKDPSFKHHEMRNTPLGVGFGNDGHSLVVALRGGELRWLRSSSKRKGGGWTLLLANYIAVLIG